jgi:MYXO-CTERM domain-containing protein
MSRIRSALALVALGLFAVAGHAQTNPAVSTIVAFSLSNPVGNLVQGADGALYGVSSPATSITGGVIYRTTPDGSDVRTLYQLKPEDALSPAGGLALASDGLLYGTTKFGQAGQIDGAGSIFRIAASGNGFQIIHRFAPVTASNQDGSPINTNGAYPEAELVEGADGYLYGTTRAGGPNGTGTVFKISRDGTDFKPLYVFAAITSAAGSGLTVTQDGAAPVGPLVAGADSYFYGTASQGGTNGRGTVFRIAFDGTGFQVLHHFSATTADATTGLLENADGATPLGGLVDGGDGFLYGLTAQGGIDGNGVIFAIPADGSTFNVLHSFTGADGARPIAELMVASSGKLYGVTSTGGVNAEGTTTTLGTIFSIDRAGTGFARLYSFDGKNGSLPSSRLLETASGVFVGVATSTGNCSYGTIFRYSLAGDTVSGNTRCGRKKNNSGGGSAGFAVLLLLAGLGLLRRRAT